MISEDIERFGLPKVVIDPGTLADILLAIHICPVEVSGLAQARREGHVIHVFGDALIFPQTCSLHGTRFGTEGDPGAYTKWNQMMTRDEKRWDERDRYTNFWWHSHVFARTYWSETDKNNMERWMQPVRKGDQYLQEWLLSLVGNKFGSTRLRLDWVVDDNTVENGTISQLRIEPSISKEGFRTVMLDRQEDITRKIRDNVTVLDEPSRRFSMILDGMFLDVQGDSGDA